MATLVTGGSGFVGRHWLARHPEAVVATRRDPPPAASRSTRFLAWPQPHQSTVDLRGIGPIDHVVNLMGESVAAGRWTPEKKTRIRQSRVDATRNLIASLERLERPPYTLVSASASGYYGSRGEQPLDEAAAAGEGFLSDVCREWEEAALEARHLGIRVVLIRISLVLGKGGALAGLLPLFRWSLGGRLGSGRQWMSWIHIADLVDVLDFGLAQTTLAGPVNAASPHPVRNAEFTRLLARGVRRPALLPVPKWAARLARGEFAESLYQSSRLEPAKLLAAGFPFRFPHLPAALADIL